MNYYVFVITIYLRSDQRLLPIYMASGVRAVVSFEGESVCPLALIANQENERIDTVARNVRPQGCEQTTSEFTINASVDVQSTLSSIEAVTSIQPVFSTDTFTRYRITHSSGIDCPCECLGCCGCPVYRYVAEDGSLTIEFCTTGFEELQTVIGELRSLFDSLSIDRLIQSPAEHTSTEFVMVDKARLTGRQREVMEVAREKGYFDLPRRTNATELATELDLHPSTVSEHLRTAEKKMLDQLF